MKRLFALFLALVMMVAFSACKSNQEKLQKEAEVETDTNTESISEPVEIPEKTESEAELSTDAPEDAQAVPEIKPIEVTEKEPEPEPKPEPEPEASPIPEASDETPSEEPTEIPEAVPCLVCESTEHEIHPIEDYNQYRDLGEGRYFGRKSTYDHFLLDERNKPIKNLGPINWLGEFHCGLARIYKDTGGKAYGYVDRNGNLAIEFPYEFESGWEAPPTGTYFHQMYDFVDNMAYVSIAVEGVHHKVGINTLGNVFGCVECGRKGVDWKTVHPESFAVIENASLND